MAKLQSQVEEKKEGTGLSTSISEKDANDEDFPGKKQRQYLTPKLDRPQD